MRAQGLHGAARVVQGHGRSHRREHPVVSERAAERAPKPIAAGTRLPPLTRDGESVLSWASGNPNPNVAEALLEAGVDPNPGNAEPPLLSFASFSVNPDVIQALLEAGADVNGRSIKVIPGMLEFKPFFLPGTTPLMLACDNISIEDIVPFISVFLDGGANPNDANEGGYTPLMFAANKRYKTGSTADVIRLLIQAGADPNARNESGLTARDIAEANPKLAEIDLDAAFDLRSSLQHVAATFAHLDAL